MILVTHDARYLHYAHRVFYLRDGQLVREVANSEREQVREERVQPFVAHALAEFARYYPQLDEGDLKAKFLGHYLLGVKSESAQERLEHLIRERFAGSLSKPELILALNRSYVDGGVGLYEQRAQHLADELDKILEGSDYIHRQFKEFPNRYDILKIGIEYLRNTLIASYASALAPEELQRFDAMIKARLEGSIDHKEFRALLDKPWREGGLGLHYQTAENFSTRLELALIDYPQELRPVSAASVVPPPLAVTASEIKQP